MPTNLVLISHKYSQRNTNLGITFCQRCENLFSLQSEGLERCVKNDGFSQKLRWTQGKNHKFSHLHDCWPQYHTKHQKDMLVYEFLQGIPFTIEPADYTKVPHPSPSSG